MINKTLLLCVALTAGSAQAMTKCIDANGNVTYNTGFTCPPGQTRQGVDVEHQPQSGLRQGERDMLNRIEAREQNQQYRKQQARDFERRNTLTFSEQKRLRELKMEKGQLSRSLSRGSKDWAEKLAIERQIRGIDRQIEQLQAPKY